MLLKRCTIIGGGNSIAEGLQKGLLSALENECKFVINFASYDFPSTANIFVDHEYYVQEKPHLDKMGLVIGRNDPKLKRIYSVSDNVILLNGSGYYFGKQSIEKGVYSGALSGTFALSLAISLGFTEIFLLGMDFGAVNGKTHYYQDDGRNLGIVKKESGEPGQYTNFTGVGFEPSNPLLYKTSCYNSSAETLFNVYNPTEFVEFNFNDEQWKELLIDLKTGKKESVIWLENYLSEKDWKVISRTPQRQKEKEEYIKFYEYKKIIIEKINLMIGDLGIAKVTEIFYPWLCEWCGIKKELQEIKIYNVSPESKINVFPKINYDTFFVMLKENPVNINQKEAQDEIRKIIESRK